MDNIFVHFLKDVFTETLKRNNFWRSYSLKVITIGEYIHQKL